MKCFSSIFFFFAVWFLSISSLFGKEIKPQVLVYGDNIEAYSAAIQSARSGVPTLWVIPKSDYCLDLTINTADLRGQRSLIGGLWMSLLQEVSNSTLKSDSLFAATTANLDAKSLDEVMDILLLREKNLTVIKNTTVSKLVSSKNSVEIVLSNKAKYKFRSVIDATPSSDLFVLGKVELLVDSQNDSLFNSTPYITYLGEDKMRTIVSLGYLDGAIYAYPINRFLSNSVGNLFAVTPLLIGLSDDYSSLSSQIGVGQAVGALASYCAFFKTTSDKVDVRKVQTELLNFDVRLLPFADIDIDDPNFNPIQKIFLVGILPWDKSQFPMKFNGADSVSVDSVKPVIHQLYSRAQLWFIDNKSEFFTVADAIELIKVLAFRGNELNGEIEKAWKRRFKFKREFNLDQNINRYEFAVLLNAYADPFAKNINLKGEIQR